MLKGLKKDYLHMLLVFAFSILLAGCNFFDFQDDVVDDEIYEGNLDSDDVVVNAYNLQGTTIEFYDCYFGEKSDVLVLYFPDITLEEVYIKEVDIDNKIINVEIKHDTKEVVFNNGVYAIDVHGLEQTYISIHFEQGTLESNKLIQDDNVDDEPNVDVDSNAEHGVDSDEEHVSHTTNMTTLTFMCSITMPDDGYEQITYTRNFNSIKDEPLIHIFGNTTNLDEAMRMVDIESVLVLNIPGREINTIVYDKNNSSTEVYIDYDVNSFITIRTIAKNGATIDEIVERYVDTYLYILDEDYVYYSFDSGCYGNLYVCYKNDSDCQSAVAVLEYHENFTDYFYVIQIDLFGEDLNYSFKELLNKMILVKEI